MALLKYFKRTAVLTNSKGHLFDYVPSRVNCLGVGSEGFVIRECNLPAVSGQINAIKSLTIEKFKMKKRVIHMC